MSLRNWTAHGRPQAGPKGLIALSVTQGEWRALAESVESAGGWLAALWASSGQTRTPRVHAVYQAEGQGLVATLVMDGAASCPGIEDVFPAAARMQRAMTDLSGVTTTASDARPWLRHSAWPAGHHPLADPPVEGHGPAIVDSYEFVRVAGDGVHEIAVGPVHAGIIEPGHFRFSVVGEKILRLEERLGYTHKGIELLFAGMQARDGHRLAARISGDSAVAFSWAYCQAFESLAGCEIPARAAHLRALCLEIERIQNHLGDLGALGNDAGFAFGLAQFSRLKERWLRAVDAAFGQRYLMDAIVPGGTRTDIATDAIGALADCARDIAADAVGLREIYDEHPGIRDRFLGAGEIKPALARRLGMTGIAGRASGLAFDARIDVATPPYDALRPERVVLEGGDVAARVAARFEELRESCRLVSGIAASMPNGGHLTEPGPPRPDTLALGWIEGCRGSAIVALEIGPGGAVRRCHPHDPSWQNWPALEYAVIGNIVPDFPLINKSFNLSYSGHDL